MLVNNWCISHARAVCEMELFNISAQAYVIERSIFVKYNNARADV